MLLGASVLAGCSQGSHDPPRGPYYADIKAAAKQVTTDFERRVLSDGVISRAEYEEAVQRLVACGKQLNTTITPIDEYGLYEYEVPGGDPNDVMVTCDKHTTITIEPLYAETVQNPHRLDFDELIVACLIRTKLAEPTYSRTDFERDNEAANGKDATGFYPFDTNDPRYTQCNINPSSG
jgi:hypothetical protein